MDRLLAEYRPSAVVNFAAETHVDRSIDGPKAFVQTNVVETHELLEAALSYWGALEGEDHAAFRFLHVSTDEVYGTLGPEGYFTEESPFRPNSPYAASKAASDHLVRAYHHTYGLPTLTTNCSNNYGPYHFPEKLIPLMILTAMRGDPCRSTATGSRSGTGSTSRTTAGPFARCSSAAVPGETYNVGGHNERTNLEVVKTVCALLDELAPRLAARAARVAHHLRHRQAGPRQALRHRRGKIERDLGWSPEETLETGLEKTVRWYLENRSGARPCSRAGYGGERLGIRGGRREGHRARRGVGDAAVPAHQGGEQAAPARLRQAHDLLPS